MKTPHKHAAIIKAWADGALIQERFKGDGKWHFFDGVWTDDAEWEYRVKPELKADIVQFCQVYGNSCEPLTDLCYAVSNLKLTFDGETGKLKAAEVFA